jgi:protein O-mannosyl-transferase
MRLKQRQVLFLISAGIVVATLVAYEPIRHNGFVSYDDNLYITENPVIKSGITWQSLGQAFQPHYYMWHPLTTFTNLLDCQLFGLNPFWHHLVGLLFHIANALLLFWILVEMTGTTWPSAFVAAVFALHPLQVESVAWAAERKTVLSGLFWLLTMAAYIRHVKRPGAGRYILLFLVYGLCIMTKPVVVTLPLALLLLDYWPLGRVKCGCHTEGTDLVESPPQKARWQKVSVGRLIIEKIPLLALSAILSITTFIAQRHGGTVLPLAIMPLDLRIANTFISYIRYIGKIIWPSRLAAFYPHTREFSPAIVVMCTLLFVLLSILSIYIGRRRKYVAVGWLLYVGTLVPVIGLVQAGAQAMADRYMYIPMVGLLIIAAWAVKDLIANRPRLRIVAAVLAIAVLSSAVILTRMQVRHWQNSITLFDYALKVTKNNWIAENSYGCALSKVGWLDEAVLHLRKAVLINPGFFDARINLGKVLLMQGNLSEAVARFNELLERKQSSAEVYYHLAVALSRQKKYDEAIKCFARAIELDPKYPYARSGMGIILAATGRPDEAIVCFNDALRVTPDPDKADVYANLGLAYNQLGKYEQALRNWTRAAELNPNSTEVLNNLAWLLATAGDVSAQDANRAIELAERACELTGHKEPGSLDTLAAAYAAGDRFDDAVTMARQAIDAAKARGQEGAAREIQKRIELYKAGQRYIQK